MIEKVLVLSSVASMIQQFNMPFIRMLQDLGYEVHVACNFIHGNTCSNEVINELKKTLDSMQVKYHQVDFSRKLFDVVNNIKAYKQVLYLLKANRYKFIHCHSPIGGVVGRFAGHRKNSKVIYTAHGFHFYKGSPLANWVLYYPIEKLCSLYTDVLITINQEDFALASKKMKARRIFYVPGIGINTNKYFINNSDRSQKRKAIGVPDDAVMLLSVGELTKNKNHEIMIKAVAQLKDSRIHYVIAGQGRLKNYYDDLAEKYQISNRVHLVGYRSDITELYSIADIFCFPSLREGLPVSLMEAMAVGLPVVCSDIRGNRDLVEDGKGGFLVRNQSIEDYVDKIRTLIEEPHLRETMGKYNIEKVKSFDSSIVNEKMEHIYTSMKN